MTSIQIFSPHIDDAIFSLGGSILNWRKKGFNIKVHNIFTISNWITPDSISGIKDSMDLHEVTALRRNEEVVVSKYVKFEFTVWNFLELPLRKAFSERDNEKMKAEILDRIFSCLNSEDLFFFPIGIEHEDHILISELAKNFANESFNIFYYEDMPYISWGGNNEKESFKIQLVDKVPIIEKIDYNKKARVLRKYRSQVREDFISSIRAYSQSHVDNQYYERYWKKNDSAGRIPVAKI